MRVIDVAGNTWRAMSTRPYLNALVARGLQCFDGLGVHCCLPGEPLAARFVPSCFLRVVKRVSTGTLCARRAPVHYAVRGA
jgi:hypothetical protein